MTVSGQRFPASCVCGQSAQHSVIWGGNVREPVVAVVLSCLPV